MAVEVGIKSGELYDAADPAQGGQVGARFLAVYQYPAPVAPDQSQYDPDGGGLPRAVSPQEPVNLPLWHVEAEAIEDLGFTVVALKSLQFQNIHASIPPNNVKYSMHDRAKKSPGASSPTASFFASRTAFGIVHSTAPQMPARHSVLNNWKYKVIYPICQVNFIFLLSANDCHSSRN